MDLDQERKDLIIETAKLRGLTAEGIHLYEMGEDVYKVAIYDVDPRIKEFVFVWRSKRKLVELDSTIKLDGLKLSKYNCRRISQIFSKKQPFLPFFRDVKGGLEIHVKCFIKNEVFDKQMVYSLISWYYEPGDLITELYKFADKQRPSTLYTKEDTK